MTFGEIVASLMEERGYSQQELARRCGLPAPHINMTAQSIMGHSNINMTMRYADTEESQVRDASRLLPF